MRSRIRRMVVGDLPSIVEIAKLLPQWFTESGLDGIARDVQTHEGFVALDDGNLVGFAIYAADKDRNEAELTWIAVHPELHRRSIGRTLVKTVEADLTQRGFLSLEVSTMAPTVEYEPYARTRDFYHAIGFRDVRVDVKWFPSGDDRLLLGKQLRP